MRTCLAIYILWILTLIAVGGKKIFAQKPIPYVYVREADVMWSKRIWRIVDLREKINLPLYYPLNEMSNRTSLFDVIRKGVFSDELTAYDPTAAVFSPR